MPQEFLALPPTVDELIDLLAALYPERCPEPSTPDRDIWIARGERGVVRLLLSLRHQRDMKDEPE